MPDSHDLPTQSIASSSRQPSSILNRTDQHPSEAGPSRSASADRGFHADVVNCPKGDHLGVPQSSANTRGPTSPTSELSPLSCSGMTPHLDICKYPTQQLLRLLATLLQHIAGSNDQLRAELEAEEDDEMDDQHVDDNSPNVDWRPRPHSRASGRSYVPSGTSSTAELFTEPASSTLTSPALTSRSSSTASNPTSYPLSQFPLFTASKSSLSHPSALLAFHARHIPSISIEAYLLRILKYCPATNEVFLGVLVYFDRMTKLGTPAGIGGESAKVGKKGKGFAIDSYNVHRLVIAGVTVASKFFSDVFYTNSRYAKVGGLPPTELNSLELQFLLLNDFRLRVSVEEMQRYGDRLLAYAEEAGEDIGTIGVERRRNDASEWGEFEGRHGERGFEGRAFRESSGGGDSRSTRPTVEEANSASPSTTTRNPVSAASAKASLPNPVSIKYANTQPPLPPNQSPNPVTVPTSPRIAQSKTQPREAQQPQTRAQTQPMKSHTFPVSSGVPPSSVGSRTGTGGNVANAGNGADTVSGGIRDWVRGDDPIAVVGGRMTSPMRD
ncbi:glycogen storage control protein [Cryptococcus neoformans var. grubii Br795]|uniref:Glycogen storage control protein n=1 Tax=Cryptococcus neoformans Tu259-1 TaxID=1230072 RepID=A0A854QGN8_CRYNE|nr:glycogen storage control protein [Cryptococcus neoformans var. grubii AD1-83a]OXG24090.1 glycogen storage control protein [Cryptococcus neoformans var. grubii Tu259-1]OXG39561.1 glycogen storage control protein [Cryptococcus neoformans var. grubii Th84]OXG42148.1 glycogen storage control protein [Cryptococcus neoformans var. grubii MW-RSA1955]OXG46967.1 glycogen storage control protein [Cryptococcus neoformans var. grubii CHC193]OXG56051.1 glycogen storage control protein [Cryptococcus neof